MIKKFFSEVKNIIGLIIFLGIAYALLIAFNHDPVELIGWLFNKAWDMITGVANWVGKLPIFRKVVSS